MAKAITPPPPPEIGLSEGLASFDAMSDDHTKSQWFTAFVCAAIVAGDDPEQCVDVVNQLRMVGSLLRAPQHLNQAEQGGLVGVGQIPIGQDQLLNGGVFIDADGNPAQVA